MAQRSQNAISAPFRKENAALKHREMHYPAFGLAARETGASNALELGPMFMGIAQGLVLCLKCRRKTTGLPN